MRAQILFILISSRFRKSRHENGIIVKSLKIRGLSMPALRGELHPDETMGEGCGGSSNDGYYTDVDR